MIVNQLDGYTIDILRESGWSENRKHDISSWISVLSKEGYVSNEYAQLVLQEIGDLQIRTSGDKEHFGVSAHFNPVIAASGEYDRVELFNSVCNENLFPIGECFDWIIYVSESKKIYLGDWMSLSIAGNSIEYFLNNIFNPQYKLEEVYKNEDR